jgi:DNA repair exonuclease SbcCD ATPase subunit
MRIVELRAENVKRLKAVEITPKGDVVIIAGRNAQGKSSVLDAIWMALAGAAGAKETTRPIRDGEKSASVELDLGDLRVTRRWTEAGGTALIVESADGARYPSPQKVLDEFIGKLTFDPLAFAESAQKDQLATLLSVVELPFDPEKVAMERQSIYDQRTDANREVKRLEGALTELPVPPEGTPDEPVVMTVLTEALEEANAHAHRRLELDGMIVHMEQRIEEARAILESSEPELARLQGVRDELPEPLDAESVREQIATADLTNGHVRTKQERARLSGNLAAMRHNANKLTARLVEIDAHKEKALQEATMPLDGLSFDDDGVLFKDVPLAQVSDSERLRVSIAIAMALNPKIRVIRITDGSLLDTENMALIGEMASAHDFQVWIERVDESGMVGITIEDGAVA